MKNVIIFGLGEMGKKLISECLTYNTDIVIKAIIDNNSTQYEYMGIPVIKPRDLFKYTYDKIWICTVYFEEVMNQLFNECGVTENEMCFVEPVAPILESRLRQKYESQLNNLEAVSGELRDVLCYLKDHPMRMYCYPFYDEYLNKKTQIYFDVTKGLYYGDYRGKKMYLARRLNTLLKARAYFNAILMEQDFRSPHCYWNNEKTRRISGSIVDIGAAEGIFTLEIIEQVDHAYLIEADEEWVEALQYTFEAYQDKVTIIQKFISDEDCKNNTKLDTLLYSKKVDLIKMDIEGMELKALQGAEDLILSNKMQLAVCVYHHAEDNERISQWLYKRGYHCQNSKGLVVCQGDWELEGNEVDFRKALLFADNDEEEL